MADLFQKVQELVARQTRPSIGQTNVIPIRGFNLSKEPFGPTQNIGLVRWDYFSYNFSRSDDNFVPTLSGPNNFFNTIISSSDDIRHEFTNWSKGDIISLGNENIGLGLHRAWGLRLTASQPGTTIPFFIGTDQNVNFAFWVREWKKGGWRYRKIFSNIANGQPFIGTVRVPVSSYTRQTTIGESNDGFNLSVPGTEIWITTYSHSDNSDGNKVVVKGEAIGANRRFIVTANLRDYIKDWTNLSSYSPEPNWYTPTNIAPDPLTSNIDSRTRNVVNTLNIGIPKIPNWKSINVYRSTSEGLGTVMHAPTAGNTLVLSSGEAAAYPSNSRVALIAGVSGDNFDDENIVIDGASIGCPNKFDSGGEDITTDWGSLSGTHVASLDDDGLLYDDAFEPKYESNCLRFDCDLTADTAKGFFVDSLETFDLDDLFTGGNDNIINFSFYSRLLSSTADTAFAEARFQCDLSPAASDLIFSVDLNDVNTWGQSRMLFERGKQEFPDSIVVDPGYKYLKLRLYVASQQYSGTRRQFDGFTLCSFEPDDMDGGASGSRLLDDFYKASSSNSVIVKFNRPMEMPILTRTSYQSYMDSAQSHDGQYPSTAYRGGYTQIISDSAYFIERERFAKFGKGRLFHEEYRNLIESGDFSGPIHWTFQDGTDYLSSFATSGALFGGHVGRFYTSVSTNRSTYQYSRFLEGVYGSGSVTGDTAFSFSIWAKAREKGTEFYMELKDNGSPVETTNKRFQLSTSWARYSVGHRFTDDGARGQNLQAIISITNNNPSASEVFVDGAQMHEERGVAAFHRNYILPFNTIDTTDAAVISSANYEKLHSGHSLIDRNHGTIRMWWTPDLASDSGKGLGGFPRNNYLFHISSAASDIFCRFENNTTFNSRFRFEAGAATATVSGINFAQHQPIHIVCCWNGASAWMYADTVKSTMGSWDDFATSQGIWIGSEDDSTNNANGYITNFRIDTTCWSKDYVVKDYYTEMLSNSTGFALPRTTYSQVGSITRRSSETQNPIVFVDDEGIQSSTQYNYVFSVVDTMGNESPFSSSKSITTTAMPDLIVAGDSAASRIIVGNEQTDSAFVELKSSGARYHPPGFATSAGWGFAKHVESGFEFFNNTVTYDTRFTKWDNSPVSPNLIIAPKYVKTYDSANSTKHQFFEVVVEESTSSGFLANAFLYTGDAPQINHVVLDSSMYNWYLDLADDTFKTGYDVLRSGNSSIYTVNSSNSFCSTSLATQIQGRVMTVGFSKVYHTDHPSPPSSVNIPFRIYVSADNSTAYPSGSWTLIYDVIEAVPFGSPPFISQEINNVNLDEGDSIAFEIGTPPASFFKVDRTSYAEFKIIGINYKEEEGAVIDSGSGIGAFSYMATDGYFSG